MIGRVTARASGLLSLGLGVASMATVAIVAPLGASIYGNPGLVGLIGVQAAAIPISSQVESTACQAL